MAGDDMPPDFNWDVFLMDNIDIGHLWLNPDLDLQNLPENPGQFGANPADEVQPFQPQQAVDINPFPNWEQELPENENLQEMLGDLLDADTANEVQPVQPWPQQAVDINPNWGQEPPGNDNVQQMLEDLLDQDPFLNPVPNQHWPNQAQQAVDFNPLPNPGPEPPEIGPHHIQQNPLQNLGQGIFIEPAPFQDMEVDNLQHAQNEVAMVQEIPVFNHNEFVQILTLEKEDICKKMMGVGYKRTRPWIMYNSSPHDQEEHHYLIKLYAYMNHFIIGAQQPPPVHVRRNCDQATDAALCCFNEKFGSFVANAGNHIHGVQQTILNNMFCADATRVLINMFQRTNTKKSPTRVWPIHVHYVMENWWTNRHNNAVTDEELSMRTGLSVHLIKKYKKEIPTRRFDFATELFLPREPQLPLGPAPGLPPAAAPAPAPAPFVWGGEVPAAGAAVWADEAGPVWDGEDPAADAAVGGEEVPAPAAAAHAAVGRAPGPGHPPLGPNNLLVGGFRKPTLEEANLLHECVRRNPGANTFLQLPTAEKINYCQAVNCTPELMREWYNRKIRALRKVEYRRRRRLIRG